jgi:hypothetical protein
MAEDSVGIHALGTRLWRKETVHRYIQPGDAPAEAIDVDTLTGFDADALVDELRSISDSQLPVTIVNGEVIIGFSPKEFVEHLKGHSVAAEE